MVNFASCLRGIFECCSIVKSQAQPGCACGFSQSQHPITPHIQAQVSEERDSDISHVIFLQTLIENNRVKSRCFPVFKLHNKHLLPYCKVHEQLPTVFFYKEWYLCAAKILFHQYTFMCQDAYFTTVYRKNKSCPAVTVK